MGELGPIKHLFTANIRKIHTYAFPGFNKRVKIVLKNI
jgi:hypothetical protein